jgi:hypothetical protein
MLIKRRRRRERSFSQLDDYIPEEEPRWSAVYAAAVGYNVNSRSVTTFGTVPVHTAQYITPMASPQPSAVGIEEFPSMVHIASQPEPVSTLYHQQQYQDRRPPSSVYGESPAVAVTTGASLKVTYNDTNPPLPPFPSAHGPSDSQSSRIDSEVAEIMYTLDTMKMGHSASGSEASSSSSPPRASESRNHSEVAQAGPSLLL